MTWISTIGQGRAGLVGHRVYGEVEGGVIREEQRGLRAPRRPSAARPSIALSRPVRKAGTGYAGQRLIWFFDHHARAAG